MNPLNQKSPEVKVLKQMREELALQAHLFSMEAKEEWNGLEKKWQRFQADLKPVEDAIAAGARARTEAIGKMATSLRTAYQRIQGDLKKS
jgi:hypothetical protein